MYRYTPCSLNVPHSLKRPLGGFTCLLSIACGTIGSAALITAGCTFLRPDPAATGFLRCSSLSSTSDAVSSPDEVLVLLPEAAEAAGLKPSGLAAACGALPGTAAEGATAAGGSCAMAVLELLAEVASATSARTSSAVLAGICTTLDSAAPTATACCKPSSCCS